MFLLRVLLSVALAQPISLDIQPSEPYYDAWSSAVVVLAAQRGMGTGTLVNLSGKDVIFTSAHVISDYDPATDYDPSLSFPTILAGRYGGNPSLCEVRYLDFTHDIAVLVPIVPLSEVRSVPLTVADRNTVGEEIYYVGHPNANGKTLVKGALAGSYKDMWVMSGFGWMGASGSGVFDASGNYVGVVRGIDKDQDRLIESLVFVADIRHLDVARLYRAIESSSVAVVPQ